MKKQPINFIIIIAIIICKRSSVVEKKRKAVAQEGFLISCQIKIALAPAKNGMQDNKYQG
jgi:hypothetical protein